MSLNAPAAPVCLNQPNDASANDASTVLLPLLAETGVKLDEIEEDGAANAPAPSPSSVPLLMFKIAGIHWWFKSRSHAAELTAGYYNTATRDGYGAIVDICAKYRFGLTLTVSCPSPPLR